MERNYLKIKLSDLNLVLHNWRCFSTEKIQLPNQSFLLLDQNGAGKTSLISAIYSLFTKQAWPGTKLIQYLQIHKNYFGVSSQLPNWYLNGQIQASGRLGIKYEKPEIYPENCLQMQTFPKVFTYQPNDNYWLSMSRSQKLSILDDLLSQIDTEYQKNLATLTKLVLSKQKLIKHTILSEKPADETLIYTLNEQILVISLAIWQFREKFWQKLQNSLLCFSDWIESPLTNWHLYLEKSDFHGNKIKSKINSELIDFTQKPDWQKLWRREIASEKVLFGAQRDDFSLECNHLPAQNTLSRGETRLLILFIKQIGAEIIHSEDILKKQEKTPIMWLVDDIFNELDTVREAILLQEIFAKSNYFIATATQKHNIDLPIFDISTLTKADI